MEKYHITISKIEPPLQAKYIASQYFVVDEDGNVSIQKNISAAPDSDSEIDASINLLIEQLKMLESDSKLQ